MSYQKILTNTVLCVYFNGQHSSVGMELKLTFLFLYSRTLQKFKIILSNPTNSEFPWSRDPNGTRDNPLWAGGDKYGRHRCASTMAVDALGPCIARRSAAIVLYH